MTPTKGSPYTAGLGTAKTPDKSVSPVLPVCGGWVSSMVPVGTVICGSGFSRDPNSLQGRVTSHHTHSPPLACVSYSTHLSSPLLHFPPLACLIQHAPLITFPFPLLHSPPLSHVSYSTHLSSPLLHSRPLPSTPLHSHVSHTAHTSHHPPLPSPPLLCPPFPSHCRRKGLPRLVRKSADSPEVLNTRLTPAAVIMIRLCKS